MEHSVVTSPVVTGVSGSQVPHAPSCCFQKNPFLLLNRHFVRLRPVPWKSYLYCKLIGYYLKSGLTFDHTSRLITYDSRCSNWLLQWRTESPVSCGTNTDRMSPVARPCFGCRKGVEVLRLLPFGSDDCGGQCTQ